MKSKLPEPQGFSEAVLGRSYYCFCLEQALVSIRQARALVKDDVIDEDHELANIELLITDALRAS